MPGFLQRILSALVVMLIVIGRVILFWVLSWNIRLATPGLILLWFFRRMGLLLLVHNPPLVDQPCMKVARIEQTETGRASSSLKLDVPPGVGITDSELLLEWSPSNSLTSIMPNNAEYKAVFERLRLMLLAVALTASSVFAGNPIMPGADPHALVLNDTVWVYPTWSGGPGSRFFAFSSTNLTNWQRHGPVLDFEDIEWIDDDGQKVHYAWAPAILAKDGQCYFYYSVGPQNPTPSRIGVAIGGGPAGPFTDTGKPLLTGGSGFEAIDPMVFDDPRSGTTYLYAGGSAGAKLRVFELHSDLVSLAREIPVDTPPKFTEGAFMHFHNGLYYLTYSHGGWRHASYSVHHATAETPTGPWNYRGAILTSDNTRKGPGHHSFFRDPASREWRIIYHRWENQTGDGPYRGSRQICIDSVSYDEDGSICPITMTSKAAALSH